MSDLWGILLALAVIVVPLALAGVLLTWGERRQRAQAQSRERAPR